jgi:hypothetical protein
MTGGGPLDNRDGSSGAARSPSAVGEALVSAIVAYVELVDADGAAGCSPVATRGIIDERRAESGACIGSRRISGGAATHRWIARSDSDVAGDIYGRRPSVAEGSSARPDLVDSISVWQSVLIPDADHIAVGVESDSAGVGVRSEHGLR